MKKFLINIKNYYKYSIKVALGELKTEVADSYINWLWWIVQPLSFMMIYTFVFSVIFKNDTPYFASFIFIGLTCWDFFSRMLNGSVKLISVNRDIVTRVYIPKYILLLSNSFIYLFKMIISFILTIFLMLFQHVNIGINSIYVILIFILLYLLSFGIGLILMNFGVVLDDLGNLVNIILKMVFYLSGIFYNIETRLNNTLGHIMLKYNPIAFIMSQARKVLLYNNIIDYKYYILWLIISIIIIRIGIYLIDKNENSYAKVI